MRSLLSTSTTIPAIPTTPLLSPIKGYRLPVIVAVSLNSLVEQLGLTVGDRIMTSSSTRPNSHIISNSADLTSIFVTVAKPIYETTFRLLESRHETDNGNNNGATSLTSNENNIIIRNNDILGYRPTRVRIPTSTDLESLFSGESILNDSSKSSRGNPYVHYEVLSSTNSIFQKNYPMTSTCRNTNNCNDDVGYIRLTCFSRASTSGFLGAVQTLEGMGIRRYIIDVWNNYGGVIQEAML
jgi:hypothetical protein